MKTPVILLGALALTSNTLAHEHHAASEPVAQLDRPQFEPYTKSPSGAFIEQFDDGLGRWSPSEAKKKTPVGTGETFSYVGKWAVQEPTVFPGLKGDKALVATNAASHHAISAELENVIDPAKEDLVVQYEVKLQKGLECGGAYIKVLSESDQGIQAEEFSDASPYSVMFGPDKCGATNKVHLILRHKNPLTGEIEEKHLKAAPSPRISKTTNLYTLHLNSKDQSYEILINGVSSKKGSLEEDFTPAFTPEAEIDDAEDTKPEDWVDQAKITDADASKPHDWDEDAPLEIVDEDAEMPEGWLENEPATIDDPEAEKPEEWDDEEDGDWVAPSIPNPKCEDAPGCGPWAQPMKANPSYKGKWYAPLIDNPLYKGLWKARKIANPAYFEDKTPLANIGKIAAVGFEIWSMQSDITFDNIFIGYSLSEAQDFAKATFDVKKPIEDAADAAAKPADPHTHLEAGAPFDFELLKADPVYYLKTKALEFAQDLRKDPVGTIKGQPQTGAVLGGLLAVLLGTLGILLTLLSPKPKVVKKKASEAVDSANGKGKAVTKESRSATTSTSAVEVTDPTTVKKRVTIVQDVQPAPAI